MAEFSPNEQQLQFLKASGHNLLVSASAGSGKTSTMISKLVKIINEEDTPITSLLVVTYTNAAASEIKLRLYNELSKIIAVESDKQKQAWLKTQLDNIGNAEIGTLHAICKKLIVKYFYDLGESPDFGLLGEQEGKYYLDMSINNVFNKLVVDEDEEFFQLYNCYNPNRNDTKLKKLVLQLYNYRVARTNFDEWLGNFLNDSYNENLNDNVACSYILEHYRKLILSYSSRVMDLRKQAHDMSIDRYDEYLNCRYQFINEIAVCDNIETAIKVMANLNLVSKPRFSSKWSAEEQEFDCDVDKFNKSFGGVVSAFEEDLTALTPEDVRKSIIIAKQNVIKLVEVMRLVEAEYSRIKRKKNVLDFNDLEEKMLELLSNEKIRESLKSQYKYVFVDEYQDINDKQECILAHLVSGNNYYMIGDVKQSIYAFRQSSPKIFVDKYNKYLDNSNNDEVIKFNINYRSDRNILEFANTVFDKIITRGTIGIDYVADARFDSKKEYEGSNVSLSIIDASEDSDVDMDIAEANLIVDKIREILSLSKVDGSSYSYGDIAIIMRQRGDFAKVLYDTLSKHQIPVKTSMTSEFFDTFEISLLLSILKAVSNSSNDIAACGVLKNLFDVTDNELMAIRSTNYDISLHEALENYQGDASLNSKISNYHKFICDSENYLACHTISEYLKWVIRSYGLRNKLASMSEGGERVGNVEDFIVLSDNVNYEYNIDKFLEYIDIISRENTLKKVGAGNNAIEISTIHHSKGLEYPVVILSRLGKKYQLNKDSGSIIINSQFGIGLKAIDSEARTLNDTIIRSACKLANKKSEIDEEIRLLYVAMTRAKEKMYLIGAYDLNKLEDNKSKGVYYTNTSYDMIFKSIGKMDVISMLSGKPFALHEGTPSEASVAIYSPEELIEQSTESSTPPIILDQVDDELMQVLKQSIDINVNRDTTTIKNTVTNILREEVDYENLNFRPKDLSPRDKIVGVDYLKLGTAYHAVMQEINFTENYIDIEELLSSLVAGGVIDKALAKLIKIEDILKCISVLKPIIIGADKLYKEKQFLLCDNYNKLVKSTDNNTKVIVQGVIDLVVVRGEDVYLIDYKTNRGVTEEELKQEYSLQLDLYSHAFESATGLSITHKYLYSFYLGKLVEII
ncbi:MAG: hypothetical protein E7356_04805 [Clostridiales bacterium]|nr:hypothetical protein [Clostridiales bacterium]